VKVAATQRHRDPEAKHCRGPLEGKVSMGSRRCSRNGEAVSKIKPTKKRPSAKLVESARNFVLDAYDVAVDLLTTEERLALIEALRADLDLRRREIEFTAVPRRFKRNDAGKLRVAQFGDRTVITLTSVHGKAAR
jgi:hypothetical protein